MVSSLFQYRRIETTDAKAKELRSIAEKLITFAKRGDLHARRQVLRVIPDQKVVHERMALISQGFQDLKTELLLKDRFPETYSAIQQMIAETS